MGSDAIEVVNRWRAANFEREAVEGVLAEDVEWDVSEERGELEDFGEGQVGSVNRLLYTSRESGEVASVKTHRLVYTVRDGKIVRYELENLDESEVAGSPAD